MTPVYLLEALKEYLEEKTKHLMFGEEDKGGRRQPQVFIGYPPPKTANVAPPPSPVPGTRPPVPNNQVIPQAPQDLQSIFFEDEKIYPFIIVRLLDWTDEDGDLGEQAVCSVRLIFGVKSFDHHGYIDVTHLAQTVRQALLEDQHGVIGGAANVQKPLLVTVYEDQAFPYWIADADVTFVIPTVLSNVLERTDFYGRGENNGYT